MRYRQIYRQKIAEMTNYSQLYATAACYNTWN